MKYIIVLLVISTSLQSQSQDKIFTYNNAIKINPAGFRNAEFQVTYERYFQDRKSSISIIPSYILEESNGFSKQGWQFMSQYKFYLNHFNKLKRETFLGAHNYGFYSGLYGLYQDFEEDYMASYYVAKTDVWETSTFTKRIKASEGGAIIGIQIDVTERILIDYYVGGGLRFSKINDTYQDVENPDNYYETYSVLDPEYKGVKPTMGMTLGILF